MLACTGGGFQRRDNTPRFEGTGGSDLVSSYGNVRVVSPVIGTLVESHASLDSTESIEYRTTRIVALWRMKDSGRLLQVARAANNFTY
jgi:hypothetical protein